MIPVRWVAGVGGSRGEVGRPPGETRGRRGQGWRRGGGGGKTAAPQEVSWKRSAESADWQTHEPPRPCCWCVCCAAEDRIPSPVIPSLPEFRTRPAAPRLRREEVDTSPGFGTAPHSSTERSAGESDPARPRALAALAAPVCSSWIPGSSLFVKLHGGRQTCTLRAASVWSREISTKTPRVFHPAGFLDLMLLLAVVMGGRWILVGALAVILAAPPGIRGWYFLLLKQLFGLLCRSGVIREQRPRWNAMRFSSTRATFPPSVRQQTKILQNMDSCDKSKLFPTSWVGLLGEQVVPWRRGMD